MSDLDESSGSDTEMRMCATQVRNRPIRFSNGAGSSRPPPMDIEAGLLVDIFIDPASFTAGRVD